MNGDETWMTISENAGADAFQQFIAAGGDPDYAHSRSKTSFLHQACEHENLDLISKIIASGGDPDFVPPCGYPAIFQALDSDIDGSIQNDCPLDLNAAKRLIECGATTDCLDEKGKTPREFAASYGYLAQEAYDEILEPVISRKHSNG